MTRDNVERKQARTEDERIEDEDDEFIEEEEEGKYFHATGPLLSVENSYHGLQMRTFCGPIFCQPPAILVVFRYCDNIFHW